MVTSTTEEDKAEKRVAWSPSGWGLHLYLGKATAEPAPGEWVRIKLFCPKPEMTQIPPGEADMGLNRFPERFYSLQEEGREDFPGGPVIKNLPSNAGVGDSIPGWGTEIPTCLMAKNK